MVESPDTRTIHRLFEAQVERTPDAIALMAGEASLTYARLNRLANHLARRLNEWGIGPELPIGICLESSLNLAVGLLAILKSGHGYLPLDPAYPLERLSHMLADSRCPALLTQRAFLTALPTHTLRVHCLEEGAALHSQEHPDNPSSHVTPESLAYILYTSGSTGQPKGIVMPHRPLVNLIDWQIATATPNQPGRTLQFTPISFDVSFQEFFSTWCAGGTLVTMPAILRRDARGLVQFLVEQQIDRLFLPPVALHQLAVAAIDAEIVPIALHTVITAGDQLQITPAIVEFFTYLTDCRLINQYGPSETHVVTEYPLSGPPATWPRLPPIGRPIANCQILLLNEKLQIVADGERGELHIGGVAISNGYWQRPELNRDRFIPNPHGPGRLYKSGDLASRLPDGHLAFLGRLDHQVKIRGFRVELGEIESLLAHHPLVSEAVVVPQEDATQDKRLIAYVVPRLESGQTAGAEHVHHWQRIWDEAYRNAGQAWDDDVHLGGWNDSYTGGTLPESQVREWVTLGVERILALAPRRVLEIGCGTGLLLFPIAPTCAGYVGTDISAEGIAFIRQRLRAKSWSHSVTLFHAAADTPPAIDPVDTVILNGVIQFFPSMDYFVRVLEKILPLVEPGGRIFLGDIQSQGLLELFHTSVQLVQAPDHLTVAELRQRIRARMSEEKKLLFSPAFFAALPDHFPRISQVEIQLKPGRVVNELTRFRFDVTLHVEKTVTRPAVEPVWSPWQAERDDPERLRHHLTETAPEFHAISHVPNARLWSDLQVMTALSSLDPTLTTGALKAHAGPGGIEPEAWSDLVADLPYRAYLCWSDARHPGHYDVLLQRTDSIATVNSALFPGMRAVHADSWSAFTNNPMHSREALVPKLRHHLKQHLPDTMLPAAFVFLEQFPLTASGKLDRRRLPLPKPERPELDHPFLPPATATEGKLAEIWAEILNIHPIGRDDSFFDLGGHSLLLMPLLAQVRDTFQVEIPLTRLFENPTIAGLGAAIDGAPHGDESRTTLTAITVGELRARIHLPDAIHAQGRSAPPASSPRHIFLTGVTGFLGAFLLDELLRQTSAQVYCLVRGCKTLGKARQRMLRHFNHYGLSALITDEAIDPRIIPVLGDLAQPRLGLSETEFALLAQTVKVIYHLGAEVNLLYPYSALEAANVQGTQEILRLATLHDLKPVHYTSTLGIFESAPFVNRATIPEAARLEPESLLYGGYAQSKWIAEQLLNLARERGVPVSIYRPGGVIGHSRTGFTDTDSIVIGLLRHFLHQRIIPALEVPMDMVPVDYVCQAMVHLSLHSASQAGVFHLVHPDPITLPGLAAALNELGHAVALTDYATWLAQLKNLEIHAAENPFGPILSVLTGGMAETHLTYYEISSIGMRFQCENALNGLSGSSITCPPLDKTQLRIYLRFLLARFPALQQKSEA
ncbi:MAG: amino acid adenylation domain-containing protein [Magnetococcales bacterium]|nr:amino acid adenylation domain-containing protein [Magnetococcales bacterium]